MPELEPRIRAAVLAEPYEPLAGDEEDATVARAISIQQAGREFLYRFLKKVGAGPEGRQHVLVVRT